MKKTILILSIALAAIACSDKEKQTVNAQTAPVPPASSMVMPATTTQALPPGHPPIESVPVANTPAPPQPSSSAATVTGRVLETMNSGGYTYIKLGTKSGDQWAAVREAKVKKGSTVTIDVQMVANDFESKTLNRKFDKIIFGVLGGAAPASAPMTSAAPPAGMMNPMGTPADHMSAAGAAPVDTKVEKAEGGKTVAEVWASRTQLADKQVVVRGKVVKFLAGIMGKNWMHLRDGSGTREKGDDDLTVTTNEVAKVGDTVTVTGTVHVDKDFGAGYRYPVILEEASVKK